MPIGWPSKGYGLDGAMPMPLRMVQILWHLIVLLPFMIGLTVVILLGLIWRGIRWAGMKVAACFRCGCGGAAGGCSRARRRSS